ncbi:putative intermediate filament protein (Mdm1) [Aspergillus saccharolyticus JOP 1030-1]|uniref:Intermediate filament, regulator of G-protein signaling n=1 Tax=Aspergillus saccharolyticus JOP 1030-1 TaxID=1450539 RepID=A0A318Z0U0_9EURO|nr:intermediate filament, regulator of G-protein signaling [Aspergillus saccharolyticus JOP 1030-1]PYH40606.1 intermediate filament, regulator of G-protein signaling [Aspergillus saccharolyticus JOP 1030-1]
MALKRQEYLLLAVGGFIAWGLATQWLPVLRYLGYALVLGALLSLTTLLLLVLFTTRSTADAASPSLKKRPVAFLTHRHWDQEARGVRSRSTYKPKSLYPQSFVVSEGIDEVLSLVTRDFVASWYRHISPNPAFVNEVDRVIRTAVENLRERLLAEDLVSLLVSRIFPILTTHLKEFDVAERLVRGRNLTRNVTESEELDLAIASKYREGNLHPAAKLSLTDQKLVEQEYLRKITVGLLPKLFPASVLNSRIVSVMVREILACAVLYPITAALSDPDTWNQLVEAYGRTAIQDRKTVRKLRAALDEHASPAPRSKRGSQFPRLGPHDSERAFERFVRAIRRCDNISDARRFRALIVSQLKRESMVEGQDVTYLQRLETAKRVLDQKVAKLSTPAGSHLSHASAAASHFRRKNSASREASLVDVMHDASGLSYFMEFMDRQKLMSLVQFWIVVDGFRNPLEDDFGDEDSPSSTTWTSTDQNDMALISQRYLNKPELKVPEDSRRAVKAFLSAGKRATADQYRKARTVILTTQSAVLEELQNIYYPKFKKSDLYYKYLASDEVSSSVSHAPHSPSAADLPERRPLPPLMIRTSSQPNARPKDLRRAAVSSSDVRGMGKKLEDDDSSRRSFDSDRSAPLFDDDYDTDPLAMSTQSLGQESQNGDNEANQNQVIETMEAALNDIITNQPKNSRLEDLKSGDASPTRLTAGDQVPRSPRSSLESARTENRMDERPKPSIASLGLIDRSSRHGVFDDDLFADQQKFIEDEYEEPLATDKDPADEVHEAAPGDLGLTEAIEALTIEIEKLGSQESVVDTLTRKAELTNNTAELRILRKSKASIQREIHRKEMQRQQYIIQESDNSLYGRSTVRIKSIVVGKEEDGREFAMYVIEVQRNAGEQMPAASWAVARRYSEFHELHTKLRMRYPSVRHLEFPRRRVVLKLQKEFLQKRRQALETYLQKLLLLPEVCRSRDLRAFLSQRAITSRDESQSSRDGETKDLVTRIYNSVADGMDDFLGNFGVLDQLSTAGQNLISAATNTTTNTSTATGTVPLSPEDAVTAAEAEAELNAFEDRDLEPFIKPICDLFLEGFELNKGNNWLRGRAVVVVLHQLLGGTIERKVREGARALVQDDSLLRYLALAKDTMWPGGTLRQSKVRTGPERLRSRTEASLVLATLIPDLAGNVVGRANAQAAARRIFATLNNSRLNAHLVFTILDEIVLVLFGGVSGGVGGLDGVGRGR